ncbi:MAG TPA: hypothetical protein VFM98_03415 [Ramlibacter sp.]|uniref:hypothetical protein n=1 Tax=Ramlibacter sp. TaxID=1917967 RepID=UPI002D80C01F|nr:hypothetical protein [Ramlibacter sp.]HET8744628.1 hypothetical protein [Ramlibacter sp.]
MAFELDTPTNAKITDVLVLAEKDRAPDTDPGVGLDVQITTSNHVLTHFDGALRGALYCKNANSSAEQRQGSLEGVDPVSDLPNLTSIGQKLGQFGWDLELTGYTLTVDRGLGGKNSNIELSDCKLSGFKVQPKEGGSVVLKFRVESPNISEKLHGQLAVLKTTERPITLTAPEVQQQDLEQDR